MKKLILASNSPRRRQLLEEYGFEFQVVPSDYEEKANFQTPKQTVKNYAFQKALSVFTALDEAVAENSVVLGADTVVVFKGEILGKPNSKEQAIEMLAMLSGKAHLVYTGYCILQKGKFVVKSEKTKVVFNFLSNDKINEYVATGKPLDKAGSYGIQDGYDLVKRYKGSFNNVVGLPIEKFSKILKKSLK